MGRFPPGQGDLRPEPATPIPGRDPGCFLRRALGPGERATVTRACAAAAAALTSSNNRT